MLGRIAASAIVTTLVAAAPALAAVPAGNLVTNPGAEAAGGAVTIEQVVPIPGWTTESNFTAVQYNQELGFPTVEQSAGWGGGANFFAGGPGAAASGAAQTISVGGAAREIDAGAVTLTLSALIGGYQTQEDAAAVSAAALDAAGATLATATLPAVTMAERGSQTTLLARTASAPVPRGTRSIAVRLTATRTAGDYNDGYVDNVSLTLAEGVAQATVPVFHETVVVSKVSGTIRVRRPGSRNFVVLGGADDIPLGSTVDAKRGVVELSSVPRAGGPVQKARFYDGIFVVRQPGGITELRLSEALARCRGASASAKPKRRRLWGEGSGAFRTTGRYSAATVRGTKWLVQDSCAGTLTRVTQGSVTVRDFRARKTVIVRAGKRYLAKRQT
jgi:hypothetical protein